MVPFLVVAGWAQLRACFLRLTGTRELNLEVIRGGCTESCLKSGREALNDVACLDQEPGDRWQVSW